MKKVIFILGLIMIFTVSLVCSAEILTFEFSALAGDEANASSNSNDPNLSSSTITRGAGLTASGNGGRFNATSWALTSISDAVSGNDYMEFTITPTGGSQFSVTSIYIQLQRSGTGPRGVALRNSVDNYTSNLDQEYLISDVTSTQNFTFTFSQANSSSAVTYRIYMWAESTSGSGGIGDGSGNDIIVNGSIVTSSPTITLSESSLTGFTYEVGSGPSSEQTFTAEGSNLTDDIILTATTNYEISETPGSGYTSPITLAESGGSVAETTIYVRLKAGLSVGDYNSENITASSTDADNKTVTCSGDVY
ncbi:hypothetical protein D4R71_04060 [bacterium]|nr:MAG: hypothetical protein D4R71_04060 [bacterium]